MSFPDDLLDIRVEAALGADLTQDPSDWEWTDLGALGAGVYDEDDLIFEDDDIVTEGWGRLLAQTLQIRRGRADESSRTQPSSVSFVLDNPDGWFTPGNPLSPFYGKWQRGVPLRILVEGYDRFIGQVAEIAPEWPYGDIERGDYPGESRVRVTAAGVLRRLGQGSKPLVSALRQAITTREGVQLAGYWPLEDAEGATQAASPLPFAPPAQAKNVTFGQVEGPPGSDRLPEVRGRITARWPAPRDFGIPVVFPASVAVLFRTSQLPAGTVPVLLIEDRDGDVLVVSMSATQVFLSLTASVPHTASASMPDVWDDWCWLLVEYSDATFDTSVTFIPVGGSAATPIVAPIGFGPVLSVTVYGRSGWSFGHLMVSNSTPLDPGSLPADGWRGETAADRLRRLSSQGDFPVNVVDTGETPTPLGPQRVATSLDVAAKAVAADMGVLREELDSLDLEYRTREMLLNQVPVLVLDAAGSEIANPFLPVDDDQRLRNIVEVRLEAGSSAQVEDEASRARHGDYSDSLTLDLAADWQAAQQAGWRLHLGTWEGMRYPSVTVDLGVAPHLISDVAAVREGDRIQVVNLPSQHPAGTVDLLVEGITETLSPHQWLVEFTCSPAGPWTVGVVEDDTLGRADTAGCVLDADVDADETTWELTTTVGPEWITTASHPTEFPFDLEVAGEVVTVTAITGTSPQTATVVRSVNGVRKSHPAGTPVSLAHPAVAAL